MNCKVHERATDCFECGYKQAIEDAAKVADVGGYIADAIRALLSKGATK